MRKQGFCQPVANHDDEETSKYFYKDLPQAVLSAKLDMKPVINKISYLNENHQKFLTKCFIQSPSKKYNLYIKETNIFANKMSTRS